MRNRRLNILSAIVATTGTAYLVLQHIIESNQNLSGMSWMGLALLCTALLGIIAARIQLDKAFSIGAEARKLVTTGLYRYVRNPLYVFSILFGAGVLLFLGFKIYLPLLLPVAIIQYVRSKREAEVLEAAFGEEYRVYRQKTWF